MFFLGESRVAVTTGHCRAVLGLDPSAPLRSGSRGRPSLHESKVGCKTWFREVDLSQLLTDTFHGVSCSRAGCFRRRALRPIVTKWGDAYHGRTSPRGI